MLNDFGVKQVERPHGDPGFKNTEISALLARANSGIAIVQDGRLRHTNRRLEKMYGWEPGELVASGVDILSLVLEADHGKLRVDMQRHFAGETVPPCDLRALRRDGSIFHVRVYATPITRDGRGATLVMVADISEIVQATRTAQRRTRMLAQAERLAAIGSAETDLRTGSMLRSEGLCRLFGEPYTEAAVDEDWLLARVPADQRPLLRTLHDSVTPGDPCEIRHHILHVDGSLRLVTHCRSVEADALGRPRRALTMLRDVTEESHAASRIDRLAHFDEVTSLPNRKSLRAWLREAMARALREGRSIALLTLEVAQHKAVVETLGEAVGNDLRRVVADRLSIPVRGHDTLAYLDGGVFAALLIRQDDVREEHATHVAQAMLACLSAKVLASGNELYINASVGVATCPQDAEDADLLMQRATTAMRGAAALGPNRLAFYTPEANARSSTRLKMEAGLRRALDQGEFHLVYQPQVGLRDGRIVGVETLLRWTDPQRGPVSPADFIPLAEETGLILPIGDWVLRGACEQAAAWARAGRPMRVAVNLSVLQLQQPDLVPRVEAVLRETGLDPRHLGLEITESMIVDKLEAVTRTLCSLKALGVEISLDDFGTGHSNLAQLRKLPIDVVKIDRSLVYDVAAPAQDAAITRAVITLAHSLQMRVLAEGVETEGQLALLVANRCDQIQGYYFSRPLAAGAMTAMLEEGRQMAPHLLDRAAAEATELGVLLAQSEAARSGAAARS